MARTAGSDGSRTEEAIRAAAVSLIAAHGFEAMTMRQLAERVGLQPGALYRYFPSKAQLLATLQVAHLESLLAQWATEAPASADPLDRLRAFVDFHVRCHTLRRDEVFVANMELRSLTATDYRRVVALRARYESILISILADGQAAGVFELPDPKVAAFAMLAMLTGVGTWYRDSGRIAKRDLVAMYTRLALQCAGVAHAELAA
ncbi:MAG: TetR/AcrR family transcriptional regulator [Burkholderiaceae bacterium]